MFFEKALLNVCKDCKMYSKFGNIISVKKCISELRICSDKYLLGVPLGKAFCSEMCCHPFVPGKPAQVEDLGQLPMMACA